ncbi:isoflavone 3'-hydroxylase-like [Arachis duranensis]|uniref:Isoflavone 3'-hydroxylase-like n=1 Tax=Arachis duranensis TaxID=130453 RepID=A0A6P4D882_ARADU|nr:isoflavone 3'-hydroxylase-like [Arachis duranensis]
MVRADAAVNIKVLQNATAAHFGFRPTYRRVWMAKQKAVAVIYGDWDESYNELPRWVLGVQLTMPGTVAVLRTCPVRIKKARKEIDTQIGQDRIVDESDITNTRLPYLQNIVNETFRLHPAAPLLVPHYSSEDCTLEGYKVPQNTIVLVNAWAIHRDPKVWSDDSTQFKPERFEKEGEANNLLTFGMGRRACPGANLAQRTVTLTLGLLIQCFQWKRITSQKIDMTEDKGLTMPKKIPLETMCRLCDEQFATRIFYSKTLTRDPS